MAQSPDGSVSRRFFLSKHMQREQNLSGADADSHRPPKIDGRHHAAALGAFLALAVWLTWPQAALLGDAVVGHTVAQIDGWQKVWNLWWIRYALLSGENPLYTQMLYWPLVLPLGLQPIDLTNALLTLPVLLTSGPLTAYGVAVLLGFTLTGWFGHLLVLRVTGSLPGALLAGVIVTAAPQHMTRFLDGQLEHVALQWVVLAVLALVHATWQPTLRSGIWLGLAIALVCYTSWYHALFLALLTFVWLLWQTCAARGVWPLLRPWLVALPLLALCLLPLLPGLLTGVTTAVRDAAHWRTQAELYSVDLVDLLLPSAHHPLWGAAVTEYQAGLHLNSAGWVTTPGYVALLLALVGGLLTWRKAAVWLVLAGVLFLFALGTSLHVGGVDTGLPLPIARIFAALPGTSFAFRRQLAVLVAMVPLAVAAAYGVQALGIRLRGWRWRALLGGLFVAVLFETAPPAVNIYPDDTLPVYAALREDEGALFIVPSEPQRTSEMGSLLRAQLTHERPIVGGYVTRPPDYPMYRSAAPFKQLRNPYCAQEELIPPDPATARSALAYYGIQQIVLHQERLSSEQLACAQEWLEGFIGLEPAFNVGTVTVYDVPEFETPPFLFIDRGWFDLERNDARVWRWMSTRGNLYLVNTDDQAHMFEVRLRLESFARTRPVTLHYDNHPLGEMVVTPGQTRVYTILVQAEPGQHELRLNAPVDEDPAAGREVSISLQGVELERLR